MLRILAFLLVMAGQADAGAWPREKGEQFLSHSVVSDVRGSAGDYTTLYAEYGTTERVTLGIDLGKFDTRVDKAVGFVRLPLAAPDDQSRMAVELGLGQADGRFVWRPGISLGRGLNLNGRPGWVAVDYRALLRRRVLRSTLETDVTFGMALGSRTKAIFQVQSGTSLETGTYMRVAPSMVLEHKPGRHLEVGVTAGVLQSTDFTFKIGAWQQF